MVKFPNAEIEDSTESITKKYIGFTKVCPTFGETYRNITTILLIFSNIP